MEVDRVGLGKVWYEKAYRIGVVVPLTGTDAEMFFLNGDVFRVRKKDVRPVGLQEKQEAEKWLSRLGLARHVGRRVELLPDRIKQFMKVQANKQHGNKPLPYLEDRRRPPEKIWLRNERGMR